MGKAMPTSMFIRAAARARDAGLDLAPSEGFCAQLDNVAVHCVENHVCLGCYIRITGIFAMKGVSLDGPGNVHQVDLLPEDFNSFPTQEDVLKAFQDAESKSMTPGQIEITLEGLSPLQRQRLQQGDWYGKADIEDGDV